ncbi:NAD-dependent dehydratase [Halorubrum ezzemoulense]|uniref:NAD-dependent dehydratase n=1 Tax=Halorubrum ezzemoulense TaxID=337243 RepID=A0A256IPR3_HALEZ|nr:MULTISPECIES: SDR family oxidoreductase [Halorubrum]OYR58570.1 NAD-dependent dehydratase [Halorubrum ezzemoulense]PHQ43688.1 NAD-dependent dehydratase [Halorubrum sp. C191]QAY21465.1 SDR family oxidoreductase [Halorubrum ezzemoulense]
MNVLVAGSHGQVGQHVTRLLAESDHSVQGMVRVESQAPDIRDLGAEPVVADLTGDVSHAVEEVDAIIFAAGSGGEDVWGVDRDGAINLIDEAVSAGVERFVMLSSINADQPENSPEALREYLRAKGEADEYLQQSNLTYTIVRPGPLTNEGGTERIKTGTDLDRDAIEIPREDVARTLIATLGAESTYDETFELAAGEVSVGEALETPLQT